jgi:hypothetical protein
MKISYSEYLFSNLIKLYDKEFAELEYDLQFEKIGSLYEEFEKSKFNKDTKGEYDCIIDYLVDKYSTKIIPTIFEESNEDYIDFENGLFTGTRNQFRDCFFDNADNRNIIEWRNENDFGSFTINGVKY